MPDKNASIQLAGITNLSLMAPVKRGFVEGFVPSPTSPACNWS